MSKLSKIQEKFASLPVSTHLVLNVIISGSIYLIIFTLPFSLSAFYTTIPPVDYTKLTNYSPDGFLAYIFGIGALFGLYYWAIRLLMPIGAQQDKSKPAATPGFVFLSGLGLALILLFSYPLTAIDLFIYAIRTRGWALYNLPPLSTPPEALPASDPWLGLAGEWVDAASPYGPLWEWLSLGAFYLSGNNFLGHLFALKIIGLLAFLGCGGIVYRLLKSYRPDWALAGTIAFVWNPLGLLESIQNGHNDTVMIFLLLAAIWFFGQRLDPATVNGRELQLDLLVCLCLALSILVKFVTAIIVPFFLLVLAMQQTTWLHRFGRLFLYSLAVVGLVLLALWPSWPGLENWAALEAGRGAGRSLQALLTLGLRGWLGTNRAFDFSRNLILFIFALIYLYHLWHSFNQLRQLSSYDRRENNNLGLTIAISASFQTLFWYVLLAAPVFHAWYILWFLPLASLLLPRQRPLTAAIVFSTSALLIIPYFETLRVWYPLLLRNHFLGHLIGVPLLVLPPALTLLYSTSSTVDSEVSSG